MANLQFQRRQRGSVVSITHRLSCNTRVHLSHTKTVGPSDIEKDLDGIVQGWCCGLLSQVFPIVSRAGEEGCVNGLMRL
jgi:hypothetical protein